MDHTDRRNIELSLIIPAYNESAIILRNVEEIEQWMGQHQPDIDYEIVVIDDGSTDAMGQLIDERAKTDPRLKTLHHNGNRGRGRAIRSGFENSAGRYVICLDADLSYGPDHIPALLEPLKTGAADITLASAYHPAGSVSNVPFSRALLSRWGNRVLSVGLRGKFHTVTCVVRGFTRDVLDHLELINDGKDLHLEIIQKAELFGLRVVEIPAHLKWRDRDRGRKRKTRIVDYIPFLSMSGTIASHLSYNYVLRPGSILNIPVVGLLAATLIGVLTIIYAFGERLINLPGGLGPTKLYQALRETLINGELTLLLTGGALVVSMVFIAFYFASQQNKKNYEELYTLLNRINIRLRELQEKKNR
ncbi:glycosyltransferase family 2 protein [Bradyrhizobium sediminis]|uniref:Glycosyltransferase family 2 protein n=1 Tax=Bradyrhizobium sediminis TaxID=2840469 RepID=A0A975NIS9_9BRAD|nr:glycosyltransferase family 2 protein [Bradyrhizobium sediminis]QWG14869.1 glycosyltransferase family 2 protein [Bradyrhizobium sediminis]